MVCVLEQVRNPMQRCSTKKSSLADDLRLHDSPGSGNGREHVVVVMDGMKEFTTETLEWTLENVVTAGCTVTLLGVMPWLNIPLFSKTLHDVWMVEFKDVPPEKEKSNRRSDVKYLKVQAVMDLCEKHGVVLQKKVVMGYPSRWLVIEQISSLYATWVVFDRYHRKNIKFYARKIPFNMVIMNDDREVDIIKSRVTIVNEENSPEETPNCSVPSPRLTISEHFKKLLR
ncbi:proline-rich receptor-like protein kinase PERK3 [Quillaja saponaria]|uniref:Proline-rich receptor-like protein kinase PERK3 n=1 Tax=Quillaja saponaria TaxID=32244 RepID=A0AAD7KRV8_QUISA|nr:proline-rich receptor-like protein kinase PERK3 [Quillaja saponaria]